MSMHATQRRSPVQERSLGTVQRVLEAAAALLAGGVAVETLTTAQIAQAAGLSVGALYRFFPDKQAIVDAIAVHHMQSFEGQLFALLGQDLFASGRALLEAVIDCFVAYVEANADFRVIAFGAPGSGRSVSRPTRDAYVDSELTATLAGFVGATFAVPDPEQFAFRLRLATEIGDRLIAFAFEQSETAERRRVLAEAKALLGGYLFGA